MFCTKCGKELHEGDRFCSRCGARVREEESSSAQEVVFNPPFKREAARRTSQISREREEINKVQEKKDTDMPVFNWNLEGFPSAAPKKTEAVDFNWDSVVERRNRVRSEEDKREAELPEEAPPEEAPLTSEQLEEELFGSDYKAVPSPDSDDSVKNTSQLEKFYTYNQKQEAFQKLLDKEYERLKGMEEERKPEEESLEYTWASRLFPASAEEKETAAEENLLKEESDAKLPVTEATIDFSSVREEARRKKAQQPSDMEQCAAEEQREEKEPFPEAEQQEDGELFLSEEQQEEEKSQDTSNTEEEKGAEEGAIPSNPSGIDSEAAEADRTPPEEKSRLRYSDVFPREEVERELADQTDSGSHDSPGAGSDSAPPQIQKEKFRTELDEVEEKDEPKKMNLFVKLIIGLLILLILLEGVVIAVKLIAPDSAFSQKTNEIVESLLAALSGEEKEAEPGDETTPAGAGSFAADILEDIEKPDTIGQISEDPALKYDLSREYAFPEISDSLEFTDAVWLENEQITYAQGILTAVVEYYGKWKDANEDENLIGINKLEIGEIRTGENGYFAFCRLTFATADGSEKAVYETVHVKISQDTMVINEMKEETL